MTDNKSLILSELKSDNALLDFGRAVGAKNVGAYITSVMIAVQNDTRLMECVPQSILNSALRAASLQLSVDPGTGEAYLVSYKGKCTLIVGYKGLIELAYRTNQYRFINVAKIYEGQEVIEEQRTGYHEIKGIPTTKKVIGYLAAFGLTNGFEKDLYMTVDEIHAHAKKHNPGGYGLPNGVWKTNTAEMERKTPLRTLLRKWGKLSAAISQKLDEIEQDANEGGEIVEGELTDEATSETDAELLEEVKETIEKHDEKHEEMVNAPAWKDDGLGDGTKYNHMHVNIVNSVADVLGLDPQGAAMLLSDSYKKKAIPENMTMEQAKKWAKGLPK